MADFKKLSAVEAVNTVSDAATVLIEEDGIIKRAPKADVADFKKLSNVDVVEAPAETANVLIEENGVIKKTPKTAVGGNEEYDAVFHVFFGEDWYDISEISAENTVLASGGFDKIRDKLMNVDEMPKIILRYQANYGDYFYRTIQFTSVYLTGDGEEENGHGDDSVYMTAICYDSYTRIHYIGIRLMSDNTIDNIFIRSISCT